MTVSRSQPTTELYQHVNWIRGFLETMTADNWADNKLHIERQMDSVVEHIAALKARNAELEEKLEAQEQVWREREAIGNESGQALVDSYKSRAAELEEALRNAMQRANEGTGDQMGLNETIWAMHRIASAALSHAGPIARDGER